jgi:hypothetical protein
MCLLRLQADLLPGVDIDPSDSRAGREHGRTRLRDRICRTQGCGIYVGKPFWGAAGWRGVQKEAAILRDGSMGSATRAPSEPRSAHLVGDLARPCRVVQRACVLLVESVGWGQARQHKREAAAAQGVLQQASQLGVAVWHVGRGGGRLSAEATRWGRVLLMLLGGCG